MFNIEWWSTQLVKDWRNLARVSPVYFSKSPISRVDYDDQLPLDGLRIERLRRSLELYRSKLSESCRSERTLGYGRIYEVYPIDKRDRRIMKSRGYLAEICLKDSSISKKRSISLAKRITGYRGLERYSPIGFDKYSFDEFGTYRAKYPWKHLFELFFQGDGAAFRFLKSGYILNEFMSDFRMERIKSTLSKLYRKREVLALYKDIKRIPILKDNLVVSRPRLVYSIVNRIFKVNHLVRQVPDRFLFQDACNNGLFKPSLFLDISFSGLDIDTIIVNKAVLIDEERPLREKLIYRINRVFKLNILPGIAMSNESPYRKSNRRLLGLFKGFRPWRSSINNELRGAESFNVSISMNSIMGIFEHFYLRGHIRELTKTKGLIRFINEHIIRIPLNTQLSFFDRSLFASYIKNLYRFKKWFRTEDFFSDYFLFNTKDHFYFLISLLSTPRLLFAFNFSFKTILWPILNNFIYSNSHNRNSSIKEILGNYGLIDTQINFNLDRNRTSSSFRRDYNPKLGELNINRFLDYYINDILFRVPFKKFDTPHLDIAKIIGTLDKGIGLNAFKKPLPVNNINISLTHWFNGRISTNSLSPYRHTWQWFFNAGEDPWMPLFIKHGEDRWVSNIEHKLGRVEDLRLNPFLYSMGAINLGAFTESQMKEIRKNYDKVLKPLQLTPNNVNGPTYEYEQILTELIEERTGIPRVISRNILNENFIWEGSAKEIAPREENFTNSTHRFQTFVDKTTVENFMRTQFINHRDLHLMLLDIALPNMEAFNYIFPSLLESFNLKNIYRTMKPTLETNYSENESFSNERFGGFQDIIKGFYLDNLPSLTLTLMDKFLRWSNRHMAGIFLSKDEEIYTSNLDLSVASIINKISGKDSENTIIDRSRLLNIKDLKSNFGINLSTLSSSSRIYHPDDIFVNRNRKYYHLSKLIIPDFANVRPNQMEENLVQLNDPINRKSFFGAELWLKLFSFKMFRVELRLSLSLRVTEILFNLQGSFFESWNLLYEFMVGGLTFPVALIANLFNLRLGYVALSLLDNISIVNKFLRFSGLWRRGGRFMPRNLSLRGHYSNKVSDYFDSFLKIFEVVGRSFVPFRKIFNRQELKDTLSLIAIRRKSLTDNWEERKDSMLTDSSKKGILSNLLFWKNNISNLFGGIFKAFWDNSSLSMFNMVLARAFITYLTSSIGMRLCLDLEYLNREGLAYQFFTLAAMLTHQDIEKNRIDLLSISYLFSFMNKWLLNDQFKLSRGIFKVNSIKDLDMDSGDELKEGFINDGLIWSIMGKSSENRLNRASLINTGSDLIDSFQQDIYSSFADFGDFLSKVSTSILTG